MNNIQMSESEARSIRGMFDTQGWKTYISVIRKAREKARDAMEAATRDDVMKKAAGSCLSFKEICNIEQSVHNILQ